MRHLFAVTAATLLWSAVTAFADPVGQYFVQGTNPGSTSEYRGTVSVERAGQTYRVIWIVGSRRYVGTGIGIGNKDFIAVSYKSNRGDTGLALMALPAKTGPECGPMPAATRSAPRSGSANSHIDAAHGTRWTSTPTEA